MKEQSIYDYYAFGYNYYIWRSNWRYKKASTGVEELRQYLATIDELTLPVTANVVQPLRAYKEELEGLEQEAIPNKIADAIEKLINDADVTLDAELQLKKVLFVTPKRFDVSILLEKPQELLADDSWQWLSDLAQYDFKEATKCVALIAPTASSFHLMRCVEEMIKKLYFTYVRQNRARNPMWAQMVEDLRKRRNPRPNKELLDQLGGFQGSCRLFLSRCLLALSGLCFPRGVERDRFRAFPVPDPL